MNTTDKENSKTQELKLEPLPESMNDNHNDNHNDNVIHISRRARRPFNNVNQQTRKNRRHAFQVFTFD